MIHFVTPSNPKVFLIGVNGTRLYGFEERNKKLCILQKSIFDIGGWEEFFTIDVDVVKSSKCCKTGIHVGSGIANSTIWIVARDKKNTRLFSLNILTKELTTFKMLDQLYPEFALLNLNLCSNCVAPIIQSRGCYFSIHFLAITPRRYHKDAGIFRILVNINESDHCLLWKKIESYQLDENIALGSSNIAVNELGECLSIGAKTDDNRIKTMSVNFGTNERRDTDLPDVDDGDIDSVWHEITFCTENFSRLYCLTRRQNGNNDDAMLRLYYLKFSHEDASINMYCILSITVDSTFPSLESSQFFISYRNHEDDQPTTPLIIAPLYHHESQSYVEPTFFIIETSNGIVTIPLRMLSLSESAYLSLCQIPEELPIIESKFSFFQWLINLFFPQKSNKKIQDPWMSLGFIKKTVGLSNDFDLV